MKTKKEHEKPLDESIKFVYVDTEDRVIEFDPETGEGEPIEPFCNDRTLRESSAAVENEPACGVVRAYCGVDGHWHFDGYLTTAERLELLLFRDSCERARHEKAKAS